ncbi:helix-turn-helix domain-containing protein [Clostridium sp. 'deep sea']|nr:helix-turn-helix domain-containing protein [Clostridium sp. 'deep sea']
MKQLSQLINKRTTFIREFAKIMQVGQSTISQWENG